MSAQSSDNNKRIAKNTLLLYFRMLFMMVVSLYTSRVILNALGVEDFGIYNVVGGLVSMFSVISGSLSAAISRFITYELGKGDQSNLNKIFSASVTIQLLLSLIIVVLIESVGVWFLNTKMTIPADRMTAANRVLQFSIVTFLINLGSVPYNAAIFAHEKMSAFAYISILEAVGKLTIAFLIMWSPIDELICYAILMCAVAVIVRLTYGHYCKKHFAECTYHFHWDKEILKRMFGFAGWNFIGSIAGILRGQGINVLLNLFFTPIVNAAQGIAVQVNNALCQFSNNFLTAINPQIIKSYSQNELDRAYDLVLYASRFAFLLLLVLSSPIICETEVILKLWLKNVPDYAAVFVRLSLILAICDAVSLPLVTLQQATGKLRNYQLVVGVLHMLNFPISLLFLYIDFEPSIVYYIAIILSVISLYARLIMQRRLIGISIVMFHKKVLSRICLVGVLNFFSLTLLRKYAENQYVSIVIAFLCSLILSIIVGLNKSEINYFITKIKTKI